MRAVSAARQDWAIAVGGLALAVLLLIFGRGVPGGAGPTVALSLTIIPSDAEQLSCRSAFRVDEFGCAKDDKGPDQRSSARLRPYVTVERELLLLAGLFEEAHVAAWLAHARATGDSARVTLDCTANKLGVAADAEVQWGASQPWHAERDLPAAQVTRCTIRP